MSTQTDRDSPLSRDGTVPPVLLRRLAGINLDDLFDAAGISCLRRTPLQWLLAPWAWRFARVAQEFDRRVGEQGLAQGSSWLLHRMSAGAQVAGLEHVPASGATLIVANHPGMTDTVALLASLGARADLRVIALARPFLRALPHLARHLIFVPEDPAGRLAVVRAGARHLDRGGALLSFAAGDIEPDPAGGGRRAALESLQRWSDSFVLFARLVPQTRFVPAIVSHVVSTAALRHPLTVLRRGAQDKARLAAALQVALPRYQRMQARVAFGPPQQADTADAFALRAAVLAQARRLIDASSGPLAPEPARAAAGDDAGVALAERAAMPWPVL